MVESNCGYILFMCILHKIYLPLRNCDTACTYYFLTPHSSYIIRMGKTAIVLFSILYVHYGDFPKLSNPKSPIGNKQKKIYIY